MTFELLNHFTLLNHYQCHPTPNSTRSLPIAVIQHGGLAFLLMYLICLTVVGAPLLLLETTLGKIFII